MLVLFIFSFVTISFLAFRVRFRISLSLAVISSCSTDRYLAVQYIVVSSEFVISFLKDPFVVICFLVCSQLSIKFCL